MKSQLGLRTLAVIGALSAWIALPGYAVSQQSDEQGNIAVKVNGHAITAAEVALAADDILPQIGDVPPKLRYAFIVEYLVERHLMAQEAVRLKLIDSDEYKKRIRFYQAKALRDALYATKIIPTITDEDVKKIYDEQAAKVKPVKRARARHILVGTESEAKEIVAQLDKGANFQELAKKYSTDGSKEYGGELGYFTAEEMVPEFSKAVFALDKGAISKPVKTDYGWHVIKLIDVKEGGPQPLEKVKGPIKLALLRQAVQEKINELRKRGKIDIIDPELVKLQDQVEEQRKKFEEQQRKERDSSTKSDKNN